MLMVTREALKTALREAFPIATVPKLHEGSIPVNFTRPALFIQMMPWGPRPVTSDLHEFNVRWQIVYFPTEDAVGNANQADLFQAVDKLATRFGRAKGLTAPDGTPLLLSDFSAEERDDVVYASLALCGYQRYEAASAALLGEAKIDMNLEENT